MWVNLGFHYAITVSLATEPSAKRIVNGNLQMSLDGSTGDIAKANLIDTLCVHYFITTLYFLLIILQNWLIFDRLGENLVHGKSETFLYTDATNIGSLKSISLKWNYVQNPLSLCVLFCNKNLYVSSVAVVAMNDYNAPNARYDKLRTSYNDQWLRFFSFFFVFGSAERTKLLLRAAWLPLLLM